MRTWKQPAHLCLALLYALTVLLWAAGPFPRAAVAEAGRVVFGLIGLVAAVRAARSPGLVPRARRAWRAVAVSFALLAGSPQVLLVLHAHGFTAGDDVAHVAFVVALLIALQLFPLAASARRDRWKTALDALIVLVGGTMVLWYAAFGPYVARHGLSGTVLVTAALYPLGDLALLFSVARLLLGDAGPSAQRPLRLLAAGALVFFAGDAVHGYLHGHGRVTLHSPWQFVCWITADALLAAAAVAQGRPADRAAGSRPAPSSVRYLPFGAIAVAHLLVLAAAVQEKSFYPWGGLAIGGAVLSAIVLGRQHLVQRESDERAVTDGLTGLANRGRFRETSQRALARGARTGRYSAVLVLDLNGFKQVNDTFGHKAGDLVLAEFAHLLRRAVPEPGLPARLGGDEFAVALSDLGSPEGAYEVAGRIAAAVAPVIVDGKLIDMAASIGVAVSGPGELTHDLLVHRADRAMYKAKQFAPETRWAAWRESFETDDRHHPYAAAA
jgi:diguanylate cyclase (GGDEF)-like protein